MAISTQTGLSVVLATYNEAENIGRCLRSVKDIAGEIIVVDGESTDETVHLAKKYGAKVIETTNKPMFHTNKQLAIDAARNKWILQLDADEVVDTALKNSLTAVMEKGTAYAAFYIKRKNYFLGKWLRKGGQYPDPIIRFFKRGKAYLPQKDVHEQMAVKGEVGTLTGHLLHYNAPTFHRYIENTNRYTSLTAGRLYQEKIPLTLMSDWKYLVWLPGATFFNLFLRHRGYVDGFPGFVFALFSGLHHALAYMKLGDLYRHARSN
jgi:glycosyltransferase involved in cell wall biosynthesis